MNKNIKIGDSFVECEFNNRNLYQVTKVECDRVFARKVKTFMKDWKEGTEYPETDENGKWILFGDEVVVTKTDDFYEMNGLYSQISWGDKTGYTDPFD